MDQAVRLLAEYLQLETADVSALRDQLSKPTARRFDKMSADAQRRWIAECLLEMIRRQMWMHRPGEPAASVSNEQLAKFFESGALSDEARDALLRLPGKEMYDRLRRYYRGKDFTRHQRPKSGGGPENQTPRRRPRGSDRFDGSGGPPGLGPHFSPQWSTRRPRDNRPAPERRPESPRGDGG
jgi:hypothetical protein